MIYVDESWLLWRELSSSLYDHSAERTRWALIYVFATHVNRSENRKSDRFTASHERVDAQKLSRAFAVCVCVTYMSCSVCAKTLLSFCVFEQRLCRVFAVYVIAMHVHWSDQAKNRSIYCIMQTCRCAKAELCLRSICVYVVYELNVWIQRCYCSVCDCAACKSVWKSKLIDLLRCTDVYVCKSWVVPSQWLCECRILVAARAQRRCCRSVYMSKDCVVSSQCMWLRCMYIDLIKRKTDRFTASRRRVDVQKLDRAFAVYVCMSYISSTCE